MGLDQVPQTGERVFKIDKTKPSEEVKGKSYLNEARLKEHVSGLYVDLNNINRKRIFKGIQPTRRTKEDSMGLTQ